jgi:hypothetical protein
VVELPPDHFSTDSTSTSDFTYTASTDSPDSSDSFHSNRIPSTPPTHIPSTAHLHQRRIASTPNAPCGDDFKIFPKDGLRIWSNNINTLSLSNDMAAFRELCDRLHTHRVDIIALQEINLDTTQYQVT